MYIKESSTKTLIAIELSFCLQGAVDNCVSFRHHIRHRGCSRDDQELLQSCFTQWYCGLRTAVLHIQQKSSTRKYQVPS